MPPAGGGCRRSRLGVARRYCIDHPQSRFARQLPPAGACDARFAHCHGRSSGPPIQREHAKTGTIEFFAPSSQVQHAPAGGGCRRSRLGVARRYCIDHPQSRFARQLPPAGACDARFAHCHGRSSGPPIQREHAKTGTIEFFAPSSQVQHAPAGGGCRRSRLGVARRYCIDHPQSRYARQLPPAGACQIQCKGISCPWPFTAPPSAFATAGLAPLGLGIGSGARPILASPYARRRREAPPGFAKGLILSP